jgi:hypothetical protein
MVCKAEAERRASAAAESRSAAEAGGSQLQANVRQRSRLGVPLLGLGVTPSAPDAVLVARGSVPPVCVDRGSRKRIFCAVLPVSR